ncbi:MAG: nucleotidyltransferase family protein [Candidatus Marinimicrobia bacterium]|nr:nucleotidyltransferase family protein [Candidatus Neomarinimicrobiota bacterium]
MYRKKDDLEKIVVDSSISIKEAIKKLDEAHEGVILALGKDGVLKGIFTDPDFRRAVLNNVDLNKPLAEVMNTDFISLDIDEFTAKKARKILIDNYISHLPIIDGDRKLVDVIYERDFFRKGRFSSQQLDQKLSIPAVIMAGGEGKRLDPFTRVLPKPLIPIDTKPIIEHIIDNFANWGIDEFYISIYYRAKTIKAYFEENLPDLKVSFLEEDKPLGTAGALKFITNHIKQPFFLSNCDILIEANYSKMLQFHQERGNVLTLVGSVKHHQIPYGICKTRNGGDLKKIVEKPEYDFLVNTGMYILEPEVLQYIPHNQRFDITDLIEILLNEKEKIGVFPISSGSWVDIGQWAEYKKTIEKMA